jgi:hypothetical protein
LGAAIEDHCGACFGQAARNGEPDARSRPRNDGAFARQVDDHRFVLCMETLLAEHDLSEYLGPINRFIIHAARDGSKTEEMASAPTQRRYTTEVSSTGFGANAAANSFVAFFRTRARQSAPGSRTGRLEARIGGIVTLSYRRH